MTFKGIQGPRSHHMQPHAGDLGGGRDRSPRSLPWRRVLLWPTQGCHVTLHCHPQVPILPLHGLPQVPSQGFHGLHMCNYIALSYGQSSPNLRAKSVRLSTHMAKRAQNLGLKLIVYHLSPPRYINGHQFESNTYIQFIKLVILGPFFCLLVFLIQPTVCK